MTGDQQPSDWEAAPNARPDAHVEHEVAQSPLTPPDAPAGYGPPRPADAGWQQALPPSRYQHGPPPAWEPHPSGAGWPPGPPPGGYQPWPPTGGPQPPGPARRSRTLRLALVVAVVAVIAVTVTVVLLTRGSGRHWSSQGEAAFMAQCSASSGGQTSYCQCTMQKLEAQYTEEQMAALGAAAQAGGQAAPELSRILRSVALACGAPG